MPYNLASWEEKYNIWKVNYQTIRTLLNVMNVIKKIKLFQKYIKLPFYTLPLDFYIPCRDAMLRVFSPIGFHLKFNAKSHSWITDFKDYWISRIIDDLFIFKMWIILNSYFIPSFSYLHHFFQSSLLYTILLIRKIIKIKVQTTCIVLSIRKLTNQPWFLTLTIYPINHKNQKNQSSDRICLFN